METQRLCFLRPSHSLLVPRQYSTRFAVTRPVDLTLGKNDERGAGGAVDGGRGVGVPVRRAAGGGVPWGVRGPGLLVVERARSPAHAVPMPLVNTRS